METFYIGPNIKEYRKKWKELQLYFSKEMEAKKLNPKSKAAVFRFIIDKLYNELKNHKK